MTSSLLSMDICLSSLDQGEDKATAFSHCFASHSIWGYSKEHVDDLMLLEGRNYFWVCSLGLNQKYWPLQL